MSDLGTHDIVGLGVNAIIDTNLKRHGEYRSDIRNTCAAVGGSAMLGAVGTTIGGPVLGVAMGALGHVVGRTARFPDDSASTTTSPSSEDERLRRCPTPSIDYGNL